VKKITAFVGSARKGHTYNAVVQFLNQLQSMGDIETEIVRLSDYHIGICKGCQVCFSKGESYCLLKDDRDALIEKMMASDGVVFASPNYSFQVSALMKAFLDRLGLAFHRPSFLGKTFTSIVVYFVGNALGFNSVKGSCLMTLDPMTEKQQRAIDKALAAHARRYYARLEKPAYPAATLFGLMMFRMGRTKVRLELDDTFCDYTYYAEKGWFESDYYYPTRMGVLMQGAGKLFDTIFARMTKAR